MELHEIEGWCAGVRAVDLNRFTTKDQLDKLVDATVLDFEASCIVASVNVLESELIKTLKDYGFKKCPWIKNWGHSGRKTCLFVYQIPHRLYKQLGGTNWDK